MVPDSVFDRSTRLTCWRLVHLVRPADWGMLFGVVELRFVVLLQMVDPWHLCETKFIDFNLSFIFH